VDFVILAIHRVVLVIVGSCIYGAFTRTLRDGVYSERRHSIGIVVGSPSHVRDQECWTNFDVGSYRLLSCRVELTYPFKFNIQHIVDVCEEDTRLASVSS